MRQDGRVAAGGLARLRKPLPCITDEFIRQTKALPAAGSSRLRWSTALPHGRGGGGGARCKHGSRPPHFHPSWLLPTTTERCRLASWSCWKGLEGVNEGPQAFVCSGALGPFITVPASAPAQVRAGDGSERASRRAGRRAQRQL